MPSTFKILFLFLSLFFSLFANSQNLDLAKERIETLCSSGLHGRGYYKDGAEKSANFIKSIFQNNQILSFEDSYFQIFNYSVNSFPGRVRVRVNGKSLNPGYDFVIGPATPTTRGRYDLIIPDSTLLNDTIKVIQELGRMANRGDKILVVDFEQISNVDIRWFYVFLIKFNYLNFGGYVELLPDELMWSVRRYQADHPVVKIRKSSFPENAQRINISVRAKHISSFEAKNVIGYIPGHKDEFIVFTAHYDHLGRMGRRTLFPGAQDNASGTAMVLDFADYYSENKPKYSIAFMLFFGEEAGLLGSRFYINNPLFDLANIKLVINLDMVGTGDNGITVVNGKTEGYEEIFSLIKEINQQNNLLPEVAARGEAANSDHYPFHRNNINAIFIYTRGEGTYYHSIKDRPETLSFKGYEGLFNLITNLIEKL